MHLIRVVIWGEVIRIKFNPTVETGYMSQLDVE